MRLITSTDDEEEEEEKKKKDLNLVQLGTGFMELLPLVSAEAFFRCRLVAASLLWLSSHSILHFSNL